MRCCEINFAIEETSLTFGLAEQSLNFGLDSQYTIGDIIDYKKQVMGKPSVNGVILVDDKSFEDLGEYTLKNSEILDIFNRVFKKGD